MLFEKETTRRNNLGNIVLAFSMCERLSLKYFNSQNELLAASKTGSRVVLILFLERYDDTSPMKTNLVLGSYAS